MPNTQQNEAKQSPASSLLTLEREIKRLTPQSPLGTHDYGDSKSVHDIFDKLVNGFDLEGAAVGSPDNGRYTHEQIHTHTHRCFSLMLIFSLSIFSSDFQFELS